MYVSEPNYSNPHYSNIYMYVSEPIYPQMWCSILYFFPNALFPVSCIRPYLPLSQDLRPEALS